MNKPNKTLNDRVADMLLKNEFHQDVNDEYPDEFCEECNKTREEDHNDVCEMKAICDAIRYERKDCICVDSKSPTFDEEKRECPKHGWSIL